LVRASTWLVSASIVAASVLATSAYAAEGFTCLPKKLKLGDTLVISMPTPHGGDFGVWTPKREFFFLVFWPSDSAEARQTLRNWDTFKTEPEFRLDTATSMATNWSGDRSKQLIFADAGWYRFVLDDNLETEGTPKFTCRVHFLGRRATS